MAPLEPSSTVAATAKDPVILGGPPLLALLAACTPNDSARTADLTPTLLGPLRSQPVGNLT